MGGKLKYRSSYNCHEHPVLGGLSININWDSLRPKDDKRPPWKVAVFGKVIGYFDSFEEGEAKAIEYAKTFADELKKRTDALST